MMTYVCAFTPTARNPPTPPSGPPIGSHRGCVWEYEQGCVEGNVGVLCPPSKVRYFKSKMFDPSDTFGAATPVPAAFFAIQSRAFSTVSSHPALSLQTVTENPPSSLRTRV